MIAGGTRPCYRPVANQDGSWRVDGLPGLQVATVPSGAVLEALRAAIAELLGVPPDTFDVER
jgi:hypothetical protein